MFLLSQGLRRLAGYFTVGCKRREEGRSCGSFRLCKKLPTLKCIFPETDWLGYRWSPGRHRNIRQLREDSSVRRHNPASAVAGSSRKTKAMAKSASNAQHNQPVEEKSAIYRLNLQAQKTWPQALASYLLPLRRSNIFILLKRIEQAHNQR